MTHKTRNPARFIAAALLALALTGCNETAINPNTDPNPENTPQLSGEILVELQDGYTATQLDSMLVGLDIERRGGFESGIYRIAVPEGQEEHWAGELRAKGIIRAADINRFGYAYSLVARDNLPRLQGESLYVEVAYGGCAPGHAFTLGYSPAGALAYDIWLYKQSEEDCRAAFVEVRAFKVPDEIRNADTVRLVKPLDTRIALTRVAEEDENTPPPVYEFGDPYTLFLSDSLPRLKGDSLIVDLGYTGCGPGAPFTLNHHVAGDTAEVWLHMTERGMICQAQVGDRGRVFLVPDVVKSKPVVRLVTRSLQRIELKN